MKCQEFTVIELVVVVAIIMIIAGITLPAIDEARARAKYSSFVNEKGALIGYKQFRTMTEAEVDLYVKKINEDRETRRRQSKLYPPPPKPLTLFESWCRHTGNPKKFSEEEFNILKENNLIFEFSFFHYNETSLGESRRLSNDEFEVLKKAGKIDFVASWNSEALEKKE